MSSNLRWALIGIFGLLVVASLVTWTLVKRRKDRDHSELVARVKSWWIMAAMFSLAVALDRRVSIAFLAFVSFLAFKEYLTLIPTRRADRRVLFLAYLAIPVQFYWVASEWYGMFIVFVPVYMFLALPLAMVLIGETSGYLRAVGTLQWGLMTTVFSLGHAAYLLALADEQNPNGGSPALLLFLVVLTQLNDVAQYVWGKSFGQQKIIPKVSPGKTVAGFAGGVATTIALALLLAPVLTPLSHFQALAAGALIAVGGFFGDVTISAVKRDLHVKDSGDLLPGHGGILDRVDSLTFTAPLFFHFVHYFCY